MAKNIIINEGGKRGGILGKIAVALVIVGILGYFWDGLLQEPKVVEVKEVIREYISEVPVIKDSLGGSVVVNPEWFPNGLKLGNEEVGVSWRKFSIDAGSSTGFVRNRLGKDVIVDLVEVELVATSSANVGAGYASSSSQYRLLIATSTLVSDLPAYSVSWASVIDGMFIATSTRVGTTTSNYIRYGNNQSNPSFVWKDGDYITAILHSAGTSTPIVLSNDCNGTLGTPVCYSSTSTLRGFNVKVRVRYHD